VQILTGSGTLGNDVIAAQLSLERSRRGLILSNGEFGERLVDHARRMGLDFSCVRRPWGEAFDAAEIEGAIVEDPTIGWVWAVHCETSTGVLNDLEMLKGICGERGIRLCLDCISSIGTTPVDLAGVHLASGVSGKGLRAFPGLCMVFHDVVIAPAPDRLPRYLDLGSYVDKGVPFTVCSNLVCALKTAVEQVQPAARFAEIAEHAARVRVGLTRLGLTVVANEAQASPAVVTIALPRPKMCALRVGDALADRGLLLSYRSDYLLARNWLQICLMGQYTAQTIQRMLAGLAEVTGGGGVAKKRERELSDARV
jgi:aspartate aminotransferase-like enzyme